MGGGESGSTEGEDGRWQRRDLFISYSHHDQRWLEELHLHFKALDWGDRLRIWDDKRLQPGDLWREEIEKALARARVALLLVSKHFLASEFIRRRELPPLLAAAQQDGLTILWLPVGPCAWKRVREIEQYHAVIPVSPTSPTLGEMSEGERDRALVGLTDHIDDLFARLEQEREALAEAKWEERAAAEREERAEVDQEARAEVERLRAEVERLARDKEELLRQVSDPPASARQKEAARQEEPPRAPSLITIATTRGWLAREGGAWQVKQEPITVSGYQEELAGDEALTLIQIPEGSFLMGSPKDEIDRDPDEGPQHTVILRSFFLAQTPVTQAQWQVVAGWARVERDLDPRPSSFLGAKRPVVNVSWEEAMEFCRRLSQRTGLAYTLPSEAQWEYACRAGTTTPFAFGETLSPDLANYNGADSYASGPTGASRGDTTNVGQFPANGWGLRDMHGNVWEWCLDPWHGTYQGAPTDGGTWLEGGGGARLLRGGSWFDPPGNCRSASRGNDIPDGRDSLVGFRVCCLP